MIIRIEDLKNISQTILTAVDSNELSVVTETLELVVKNSVLSMNVTNREYYASVKFPMKEESDFHATVNALLFLKLVSQITTETVEMYPKNNSLVIKGNGTYRLPMIYDEDKLLTLPEININNATTEFSVSGDTLISILTYNSNQVATAPNAKPVQRLYYVDEQGAITFTSGACVNSFSLEKPVKMLMNSKLVKLFKLFKGKTVKFTLGHDSINGGATQTKVRFDSGDVCITSILYYDTVLVNSVPVTAIRGRVTNNYPYNVNFNKDVLLSTINRFMLFYSGNKSLVAYCNMVFKSDCVVLSDPNGDSVETINYNNDTTNITSEYKATIDLLDMKKVLEAQNEQYVNVKFGDNQAFVFGCGNVFNIIPEVHD